jgi:hypothetical protein
MGNWQQTAVLFSDRFLRMGKQTGKFDNASSFCSNKNGVIVAELRTLCFAHLFNRSVANFLTAYEAVTSETNNRISK